MPKKGLTAVKVTFMTMTSVTQIWLQSYDCRPVKSIAQRPRKAAARRPRLPLLLFCCAAAWDSWIHKTLVWYSKDTLSCIFYLSYLIVVVWICQFGYKFLSGHFSLFLTLIELQILQPFTFEGRSLSLSLSFLRCLFLCTRAWTPRPVVRRF